MTPKLRWQIFLLLIISDVWQLKKLLPDLYSEPTFLAFRTDIWIAIYTMLADFSRPHPDLRAVETALRDAASVISSEQATAADGRRALRVGVWSRKLLTASSSMTTVTRG